MPLTPLGISGTIGYVDNQGCLGPEDDLEAMFQNTADLAGRDARIRTVTAAEMGYGGGSLCDVLGDLIATSSARRPTGSPPLVRAAAGGLFLSDDPEDYLER